MIRRHAEVVFGLRQPHFGFTVLERARFDLVDEIARSIVEEATDATLDVPEELVTNRATQLSRDWFAEYVLQLRDSLREISIHLEEMDWERCLMADDDFWRKVIRKSILPGQSETQHCEFKATLDMWRCPAQHRRTAEIELAKDVASFANASGGVILVGVTDKPPRRIKGVGNDRVTDDGIRNASLAIRSHLDYDREIVRFHQVALTGDAGEECRCLVIGVAQAREPVGVVTPSGAVDYPVRHPTGREPMRRTALVASKVDVHVDNFGFLSKLLQFVESN